jgi:hypothetical protein
LPGVNLHARNGGESIVEFRNVVNAEFRLRGVTLTLRLVGDGTRLTALIN